MAEYPESYAYSKEHEWISLDGEIGTIGITYHAQNELGDVVFIELPTVGDTVEQGKPFGTIESVKAVSDLYAPVSGEITEVNEGLADKPEIVNDDPHGAAWMVRIRVVDPAQMKDLMSAEEYQRHIQE